MILVDSNILLRLAQPRHQHRQAASDAIDELRIRNRETIAVVPQSLYEMYVVCTRPINANGLGMSSEDAQAEIASTRSVFQFLLETAHVFAIWEGLIGKYNVIGKPAHDVRLVAMMIEHNVPRLLTFNDGDFRRFPEITALNPFDVLGIPRLV
jgi:predicted nucleic acid-binding protein